MIRGEKKCWPAAMAISTAMNYACLVYSSQPMIDVSFVWVVITIYITAARNFSMKKLGKKSWKIKIIDNNN